jgi:DNA polymerase-3 subunit gamma/tau
MDMSFDSDTQIAYRVLARKYRPQNFDQLIGQEALVRTLTNAIQSGRVAHAFMLTGVRGVGKTTTARIIAKALNYTGADGTAGPTAGNTDDCPVCQQIAEGSHIDVLEMDAASQSKVENIRELLNGVRYAPSSARYKIYIIDEVHMLSDSAFNALLKTLEEPPPHVKFIFATTEIRKVPVTILSRCQRFDLRRVDVTTLKNHYASVCAQEQIEAEDEAIAMIARAADGSVRDGLSILDQAMALAQGKITTDQVRSMLGLADRSQLLDLMEHILSGQIENCLTTCAKLYQVGADSETILNDLLNFTHVMSKFQAVKAPPATVEPNMTEGDRTRMVAMAHKAGIPALGKMWQILLKGIGELQYAPNPQAAAEMVIIRLCYAAELPDPTTILKQLKDGGSVASSAARSIASGGHGGAQASMVSLSGASSSAVVAPAQNLPQTTAVANANLDSLTDIVALLEQHGAMSLAAQVVNFVELVKLDYGRLEFHPAEGADTKLAPDLAKKLTEITGTRWMVTLARTSGQKTLRAERQQALQAEREAVLSDPPIARIIKTFPGTDIISID